MLKCWLAVEERKVGFSKEKKRTYRNSFLFYDFQITVLEVLGLKFKGLNTFKKKEGRNSKAFRSNVRR